jgi:hypothetical protein
VFCIHFLAPALQAASGKKIAAAEFERALRIVYYSIAAVIEAVSGFVTWEI